MTELFPFSSAHVVFFTDENEEGNLDNFSGFALWENREGEEALFLGFGFPLFPNYH